MTADEARARPNDCPGQGPGPEQRRRTRRNCHTGIDKYHQITFRSVMLGAATGTAVTDNSILKEDSLKQLRCQLFQYHWKNSLWSAILFFVKQSKRNSYPHSWFLFSAPSRSAGE